MWRPCIIRRKPQQPFPHNHTCEGRRAPSCPILDLTSPAARRWLPEPPAESGLPWRSASLRPAPTSPSATCPPTPHGPAWPTPPPASGPKASPLLNTIWTCSRWRPSTPPFGRPPPTWAGSTSWSTTPVSDAAPPPWKLPKRIGMPSSTPTSRAPSSAPRLRPGP